jgi:hypothetical protein
VQTAASLEEVDATLDQVVTGWTPTRPLRAGISRRETPTRPNLDHHRS